MRARRAATSREPMFREDQYDFGEGDNEKLTDLASLCLPLWLSLSVSTSSVVLRPDKATSSPLPTPAIL